MKIVQANKQTKIVLSQQAWRFIGKRAGWLKLAQHLSSTLPIYKTWLASNPDPQQVKFVDEVYALCEKHYEAGGDTVVETMTPEEVLKEFKSLPDVVEYCGLRVEQEMNARWGEDSDPQLERGRKFDQWKHEKQIPESKLHQTEEGRLSQPDSREPYLSAAKFNLRTASKLQWNRMPSVTGGGKEYFFTADTPHGRKWVVWDRVDKDWAVHGEQAPPRGEAPDHGHFPSDAAARQFVEQTFGTPSAGVAKQAGAGKSQRVPCPACGGSGGIGHCNFCNASGTVSPPKAESYHRRKRQEQKSK